MQKGWCVVDGGATKTLGSVRAVQSVLDCNQAGDGNTRLLGVDTSKQPIFSFGNSSENRCVSTVELGVKAGGKNGKLTVHTLDQGSGPILLSVASLRALGAIIDFQNDLIVFRAIDPCRWVHKINKASAKKSNLVCLCETELEIPLKGTETVAQLENLAMKQAYRIAQPAGADVVGFGKFAALEYRDINRYQLGYRDWILKTARESAECDFRLRRLATWLQANPPLPQEKSVEKLFEKGEGETHRPQPSTMLSSASSASSTTSTEKGQIMQVLQQLAGAVQNLQEEVTEMKEDRPRRKESRKPMSETTSEGYQKVEKP
eukprot:s10372_g2.t1